MTLRGTLSELEIVDLVQFPSTGRKTGELAVTRMDEDASLYYNKGDLNHVVTGTLSGMEALTEVLSWTEGEFEFRLDIESDERTIECDPNMALMIALTTKDELFFSLCYLS